MTFLKTIFSIYELESVDPFNKQFVNVITILTFIGTMMIISFTNMFDNRIVSLAASSFMYGCAVLLYRIINPDNSNIDINNVIGTISYLTSFDILQKLWRILYYDNSFTDIDNEIQDIQEGSDVVKDGIYACIGFMLLYGAFAMSRITTIHSLSMSSWILYVVWEYIVPSQNILDANRSNQYIFLIIFLLSKFLNLLPNKVFHTTDTFIRYCLYAILFFKSSTSFLSTVEAFGSVDSDGVDYVDGDVLTDDVEDDVEGDDGYIQIKSSISAIMFFINWAMFMISNKGTPRIITGIATGLTYGVALYIMFFERLHVWIRSLYLLVKPYLDKVMVFVVEHIVKPLEQFFKSLKHILVVVFDAIKPFLDIIWKYLKPILEKIIAWIAKYIALFQYAIVLFLLWTVSAEDHGSSGKFRMLWILRYVMYPVILALLTQTKFDNEDDAQESLRNQDGSFNFTISAFVKTALEGCIAILSSYNLATGGYRLSLSFQKAVLNVLVLLLTQKDTIFEFANSYKSVATYMSVMASFISIVGKHKYTGDSVVQYQVAWSKNITTLASLAAWMEKFNMEYVLVYDCIQHITIGMLMFLCSIINPSNLSLNSVVDFTYLSIYNTISSSVRLGLGLYENSIIDVAIAGGLFVWGNLLTQFSTKFTLGQQTILSRIMLNYLKYVQFLIYSIIITSKIISVTKNIFIIIPLAVVLIALSIVMATKQINPVDMIYNNVQSMLLRVYNLNMKLIEQYESESI